MVCYHTQFQEPSLSDANVTSIPEFQIISDGRNLKDAKMG